MGLGLIATRVLELFELFDNDGSGAIEEKEFVKGLFPEYFQIIYGGGSDAEEENLPDFDLSQRLAFIEAERQHETNMRLAVDHAPTELTASKASDVRRPS